MKKNSGALVTIKKTGKKGRTYHKDGEVNGKIPVHLIDDNFEPTGKKVLVSVYNLEINGFID